MSSLIAGSGVSWPFGKGDLFQGYSWHIFNKLIVEGKTPFALPGIINRHLRLELCRISKKQVGWPGC